jgi:hypothetical protein
VRLRPNRGFQRYLAYDVAPKNKSCPRRSLIVGDTACEDAERCRPSMGVDVAEQGIVESPGSAGVSPYPILDDGILSKTGNDSTTVPAILCLYEICD